MNTKVVLLISLLAVPGPVLITPAIAADIEPIIEEAAAYNWTGFYVGAHVGYGEADVNGEFDQEDTGLIFGLEPNGLIGGVHAGFDWQISSFVLGVEGDFSWADWEDEGRTKMIEDPAHTVYEPTPEDVQAWRDAAAPLLDAWKADVAAKGYDADAIHEALIRSLEKHGALYQ